MKYENQFYVSMGLAIMTTEKGYWPIKVSANDIHQSFQIVI